MHPEFAPIAILAVVFLLVPLPSHWRARNVATLSIIFWLFISNIIYAVDAIVWSDNVDIVIPVWCDITSKIIIGSNFALPAACLCICIHLEQVASVRLARSNQMDKRRRQIFEAFMCFGLPVLFMGLHYIVQGHRFDIIEEYGCRPTTYISIAAILIVWVPPIIMAIACLIFAALALRHFIKRRVTFAMHLNTSRSALTTSRYLRLMLMSALQMIWSISITAYTLWFTTFTIPLRPWTTWSDVHSNFSRIDLYPTIFLPPVFITNYYVLWWTVPASTFIFVAFFAFGQDAVEEYKACFMWFRRRVLRQSIDNGKSSKGTFGSLPMARTPRGDAISIPITSTNSSLPPYQPQTPPSPNKYQSNFDELDYDSRSDASHYESGVSLSYYTEPKGAESIADLSPSTPSPLSQLEVSPFRPPGVPSTPFSPPSPLTPPPPPHVRVRADGAGNQSPPTSPRPFTYPSLDASHRDVTHAM